MTKIRVLQILPSFVTGGAERFVVQLMHALDPSRFDVAALSLYGRQRTQLETLLAEYELPVRFLDKRRGFDPRMFQRVFEVLRDWKPHVVHTHLHAFNYVVPAVLTKRARNVIHTVHSIAERERKRIGKWPPKLLFSKSVTAVAIAAEVQASIQRVYGVSSVLIPNGIPLDRYQGGAACREQWRAHEGFTSSDVLFVSVGRFDPVKNHQLLIQAFALGCQSAGNAHLLLAGDGDRKRNLQALAGDLGLSGRVHFLGVRDDIPALLGACDVFVFASDHEGSPLSLMEAMAAGLPIVGTAVGGVPEMAPAGQVGLLAPRRDCQSLAAAMASLYRDADRRAAMGRNAARHAAHFDIANMADAYASLYTSLAEREFPLVPCPLAGNCRA